MHPKPTKRHEQCALEVPPLIGRATRQWAALGLLIFGLQLSLVCSRNFWFTTPLQARLLGIVLILAMLPWTARPLARWLRTAERLSRRGRWAVTGLVLLGTLALLLDSARVQNRDVSLKYHDQFSYLLQARMLSAGRLWMPRHPLADFFDQYQVIVDPVYCSIYFPGAAMLLVPGLWLHLPPWAMGLFASAACAALTYFIVARLVTDLAGILAALMVAQNDILHAVSVVLASSVTVLLYGLLALAAWLCWEDALRARRDGPPSWRPPWRPRAWTVAVGALLGLAAITRPLDALCFALPIGIAMAIAVCASPAAAQRRPPIFRLAALAAWLAIGAAPFLSLQIAFDHAVTGHYLQTPWELDSQRDYPQTTLGFHHFDPKLVSHSTVPEKRARAAQRTWDLVRQHTPLNELRRWTTDRIPEILRNTTPNPFVFVLIPLGLVALRPRQWVMAAMVVLFPLAYYFYAFFLLPYQVPVIPAMSLVAVVGAAAIPRVWPRIAAPATVFLTLGIAVICVTELPEFHRARWAGFSAPPELARIESALASLPPGRAIVMFKYAPERSTEIEPVHNETVCWPDDARIIRAQDLGDRDLELYRYYAQRQPDRIVYRYDRGNETLTRLGSVTELAASPGP
jgi:hypothetical protein